jgi:hypothetical protein
MDWSNATKFTASADVPVSCCRKQRPLCGEQIRKETAEVAAKDIFTHVRRVHHLLFTFTM